MMIVRVLLVLSALAIAEIALLVFLFTEAGFLWTIAVLLLAGALGALLAKRQGFRAWTAIRADLAARRPPTTAVIDGLLVLIAGVLLLLPGLITDLLAILLLIPQVRAVLRAPLLAYLTHRVSLRFRRFTDRAAGGGEVIDAEFRRADAPALDDRRSP